MSTERAYSATAAALAVVFSFVSPAAGQQVPDPGRPMSAIDWLSEQPAPLPVLQAPDEPDVAQSGSVASVTVKPLDTDAPVAVGLVPSHVSGLPQTLWQGAPAATLAARLQDMPTLSLPAARALFYTLLLAEALPPETGDATGFHLARVDALVRLGAIDPAASLVEQIGPDRSKAALARHFDLALLTEQEDGACAMIGAKPHLAPGYGARIYCAARAGDWSNAGLLLGTANALSLLPQAQGDALERFLDPELFEDAAALPVPATPDPLVFRLHEALGQPVNVSQWPRAYAHANLRDVAGWKAQLDAAERLAQVGALPANRLLGFYSERRPAASGATWDRVAAVQRLDTALRTQSVEAVTKTLPTAWRLMHEAGLADPFAHSFAETIWSTAPDARHALDVALLSPIYETAAQQASDSFATRLAKGQPTAPGTDLERAIAAGFDGTGKNQSTALALHLLDALERLESGAQGDLAQLSRGLRDLRAVGLEDTARRAALQILLAERS